MWHLNLFNRTRVKTARLMRPFLGSTKGGHNSGILLYLGKYLKVLYSKCLAAYTSSVDRIKLECRCALFATVSSTPGPSSQMDFIYHHIALHITKTCLYNSDPLKPHFYIVKLGFTGVYIIFLLLLKNIDCGYSLELPHRGGSSEYPQSVF